MDRRHDTLREGAVVGALGASAVALWFLVVDALAGRPLFTPTALGHALFRTGGSADDGTLQLGVVLGYTVFHFLAFFLVGVVAAFFSRVAEREPMVGGLFVVLFVMFEVGFYGLVAILDGTGILQELAWYQVGAGNLLATLVMGGALLRTHPQVLVGMREALSDAQL